MIRVLIVLATLNFIDCKYTRYEYVGSDGHVNYEAKLPAGAQVGKFGFGMPTEFGYPVVLTKLTVKPSAARAVKLLTATLSVNGKEAEASAVKITMSHANQVVELQGKKCCNEIPATLRLEQDTTDHFPFEIVLRSEFASLGKLPDSLEVTVTAGTDQGNRSMARTFRKRAFEDRGFIRIH